MKRIILSLVFLAVMLGSVAVGFTENTLFGLLVPVFAFSCIGLGYTIGKKRASVTAFIVAACGGLALGYCFLLAWTTGGIIISNGEPSFLFGGSAMFVVTTISGLVTGLGIKGMRTPKGHVRYEQKPDDAA